MKQPDPKRLTQGSREHLCFSDGFQATFPAQLFLPPQILDGVHIRRSWWPVNKFDVGLPRKPSLNYMRIVNLVFLLALDYSIGISTLTDGTSTCSKMCLYWGRLDALLYDGVFQPHVGDQPQQWMHTRPLRVEADTFWVVTLFAWTVTTLGPSFAELNVDPSDNMTFPLSIDTALSKC
jgi:hypothetical protein